MLVMLYREEGLLWIAIFNAVVCKALLVETLPKGPLDGLRKADF